MKQIIILIAITFFIQKGSAMNTLRGNLVNSGSKEAAVILYQSYSSSEKAQVWVDKMNQVIGLSCWNSDQINLLVSLRGQLSSSVFSDSAAFLVFENFVNSWKTSAILKFSAQQLRFIVTTVADYSPDDIPHSGGGSAPDCNCSTASDWCGGGIFDETCFKINCMENTGCGTFWQYRCTGTCAGAQPSRSGQLIF